MVLEIICFLTDVLRNNSSLNTEGTNLVQRKYFLYVKLKWFGFFFFFFPWKNILNEYL